MNLGTKLCEACHKEFTKTGMNQKVCSEECHKIKYREYQKQYAYKTGRIKNPGVGSGNAQGRWKDHHSYTKGLGSYQQFVKEECERCGSTKNLVVHHKDHDHSNQDEVNNFETLCKSCHQKEHGCWNNFGDRSGKNHHRSKQVIIDGVEYGSLRQAELATGIDRKKLAKGLE